MGGLVKYVTRDPSLDGYTARIEAGTNSVYNGDGAGYNFRGSMNVPLNDTWALRGSAFTRKDPGTSTIQPPVWKASTKLQRAAACFRPCGGRRKFCR